MILNESEVTERMESPLNLLNRLRSASSHKSNAIPSLPPQASEVIDDLEDKLKHGSIRSKAAGIMIAAMDELSSRIPEVQKAEQLARIAESMSKVVNAKNENDNKDKLNQPQFHVFAPQFNYENHYETIHARE